MAVAVEEIVAEVSAREADKWCRLSRHSLILVDATSCHVFPQSLDAVLTQTVRCVSRTWKKMTLNTKQKLTHVTHSPSTHCFEKERKKERKKSTDRLHD